MRLRPAFLLLLSVIASTAAAQQPFASDSAITALMKGRVEAGWTPGMVIGLLLPDGSHRILAQGNGTNGRPLDGRSVYEIGSITKVFTGILLAEMAERGEVKLDEPVAALLPPGTHVPERNGRKITLLDLSTQSSGLPRLPDNMSFSNPANPYADYTDSMLFAFLGSYTLPRDIGSQYEYSNLGVGLLGNALARRAKKPYEDLVLERVVTPLGMHDTRVTLTVDDRARLAPGVDADMQPQSLWDLPALAGAGALRSTANDMLTFLAANLNGVPGALGKAMTLAQQPRREAGNPALKIGLGWHILTRNGHEIIWHNGGTGGYRTFIGFDKARRIGLVLLSNSANDNDDVAFHLLDSASPLVEARSRPSVPVSESILESYVGEYQLAPGFTITVTREGTALFGQATGQPRFRLYASSEREFFLRVVQARVEFQKAPTGAVTSLVLFQNGQEIPGRKIR